MLMCALLWVEIMVCVRCLGLELSQINAIYVPLQLPLPCSLLTLMPM